MVSSTPVNLNDPGLEIETSFIRGRNTLLARAVFSTLFVDYYLHNSDHHIRYPEFQDTLFKRALAGFVLHCATRPRNEMTAWTLHFEALKLNLFLTGDNETGTVTGRLFDENVREMGANQFFSEVVRGTQPKRRSVTQFEGEDPLRAIEAFYRDSEQRNLRLFEIDEDSFAMLEEHPDCDTTWFNAVELAGLRGIETRETLAPMEKRICRWHCGCNEGRILQVLMPMYRDNADDLFRGEPSIEVRCPRCSARYAVTRAQLDAFATGAGAPPSEPPASEPPAGS